MFSTVRYFIKTSIIFLLIGLLSGLYMLFAKSYLNIWPHPELVSAHTHIMLSGSVMMMIMGVALWFFPRPEKDDPLYKPELILISYYLMAISTAVRFISQVLLSIIAPNEILKFILMISSLDQIAGLIIFFISMWGRIRSVG
ncbi:MAG: hypothetical protein A3J84_03750, partial [Ignavibacteria bacterium RIFOXYA2_FULL_37_17]